MRRPQEKHVLVAGTQLATEQVGGPAIGYQARGSYHPFQNSHG